MNNGRHEKPHKCKPMTQEKKDNFIGVVGGAVLFPLIALAAWWVSGKTGARLA